MSKLTDIKCRSAKPEKKAYKLSDGGWLYLDVRPAGVRNPYKNK